MYVIEKSIMYFIARDIFTNCRHFHSTKKCIFQIIFKNYLRVIIHNNISVTILFLKTDGYGWAGDIRSNIRIADTEFVRDRGEVKEEEEGK